MDNHHITTEQQLIDLIGEPSDFVKNKIVAKIEDEMKAFIELSPLVFISTIDEDGNPDVSPKGDPAGFVIVNNETEICIPDRLGNRLIYGFKNILRNPSIGLIFVVPNYRETLRIKGKAVLSNDPELLASMSVNGKPALLSMNITVEKCFFHCGKAMVRSRVWKPESWAQDVKSLISQNAAKRISSEVDYTAEVESDLEKVYTDYLY